MPGPGRSGLQHMAQTGHVNAQVIGVALVPGSPDLGEQPPSGHQLPGMTQENLQQAPLRRREAYRLRPVEHGVRGEVDLVCANTYPDRQGCRVPAAARSYLRTRRLM